MGRRTQKNEKISSKQLKKSHKNNEKISSKQFKKSHKKNSTKKYTNSINNHSKKIPKLTLKKLQQKNSKKLQQQNNNNNTPRKSKSMTDSLTSRRFQSNYTINPNTQIFKS
ncbi:MAG: hypothetical protein GY739_21740, partial [Mesoflavibacter sp.]|nr:hypothetical protein [Mesoflavibacter sp.]